MTYMEDWDLESPEADPRWRVVDCIAEGRYGQALSLIAELGGLASMKSQSGDSILHDVASEGPSELLRGLIKVANPEELNAPDSHGMTPLVHAAHDGYVEAVAMLLESGATPDLATDGWTPMLTAIMDDSDKVVDALIDGGANPDGVVDSSGLGTPLCMAISHGRGNVVRSLLRAGADPDRASDRMTPLAHAVGSGDVDLVVALLDAGARPDLRDEEGGDYYAPLYNAVVDQRAEIVALLLRAGADPDLVCWTGETPREYAERAAYRRPATSVVHAIVEMFGGGRRDGKMPPN